LFALKKLHNAKVYPITGKTLNQINTWNLQYAYSGFGHGQQIPVQSRIESYKAAKGRSGNVDCFNNKPSLHLCKCAVKSQ
jgi:hypothetical protein